MARPHLEWVSAYLAGLDHVVYLTDSSGVILYSTGDLTHQGLPCLSPGYDWSERALGTNGAGTAIEAERPIAVIGAEHYSEAFSSWTCTAAPIRRNGEIVGAIDVSTSTEEATPDRMALVAHVAFVIERELALRQEARERAVYRQMAEELRARERELMTTNAELQALLDNTPAVIYLVDPDARLLKTNRRWQTLFGTANAELAGRSLHEIFPPDILERFLANNRRVLEERRAMEFEEEALSNGERRTYLSVKVPIFDATGMPYAVCGISTDITERKAAEQREREILREAGSRKQRFIAALAHELRRPLSAVMAAAEALQSPTADAAQTDSATAIIARQALHVANLVEQVLEASRIESHRLTLHKADVEIRSVLEQAIEACRPTIEEQAQRLEVSLPPEALRMNGDPTRLTQVFVNLLDNASRYSERGKPIRILAHRQDRDAVIAVRDEGRGIERELIPRIFELLFQADPERSSGGLGIGLSLVRGIVEAHGGRVDVHSDGPGSGAEFVVRLPL